MEIYNPAKNGGLTDSFFPQHENSFWYAGIVKSGVPLLLSNNSDFYFQSDSFQHPPALNDEIQFQFLLRQGTYTLDVWGSTKNDQGIQEVLLGGVSKGSLDWYSGSTVANVKKSISSFSVPASGLQLLSFKITGKNTLSSNLYASRYFWKIT